MNERNFKFVLEAESGQARAGYFQTAHGLTRTPVFMPVATQATMRGQLTESLTKLGYKTILANTYHLLLRPGTEVFESCGGIHNFMRWEGAVLTDSGGFQIFSLAKYLKMSEEGAEFKSYVDGKKVVLTPESSIKMQGAINSDIMMVLDQCIPALSDRTLSAQAMELTYRWAQRSYNARGNAKQALFGIVQGACFEDLRRLSASQITSIPFDGYAIGGLAVGEEKSRREEMISFTAPLLPRDKPRYLMGVGTPLDILDAVAVGIDMFDCVLPTAFAQQGVAFTSTGKIDFRRGVYRMSQKPVDPNCSCFTCSKYSQAYIHHLIKCGEYNGGTLLGIHNLHFYFNLMERIRSSIVSDTFSAFYQEQRQKLQAVDSEYPSKQPKRRAVKEFPSLGDYEIIEHERGSSIRQKSSGEIMHASNDPNEEARNLYIDQAQLGARLKSNTSEKLILWDVGLGAGFNAMSAIRAFEECTKAGPVRPMEIYSFENDLDSLKLALKNSSIFTHVRHQAPYALEKSGTWTSASSQLYWHLLKGDFMKTAYSAPSPDIIMFDPFSSNTNTSMWTLECFKLIYELSTENRTQLFSYSSATSTRTAMLTAGFFVAKGAATPPREETTIAIKLSAPELSNFQLLGMDWFSRWERSHNRYPSNSTEEQRSQIELKIRNHPQFSKDCPLRRNGSATI